MKSSRRRLLTSAGVFGILSGGAYVFSNGVPESVTDINTPDTTSIIGPPETETLIGTEDFGDGLSNTVPIQKIEFYESGAAIVYPEADRGACHDRFAILHENTEIGMERSSNGGAQITENDALNNWALKEFDEPITIDLAGAIAEKSNYPSNVFKIRVYPEEGVCLGRAEESFRVPRSFLPE